MKYTIVIFIMLLSSSSAIAGGQIKNLAYFKDENRNRIFLLSYSKKVTEDQIKNHAINLPHTDWRMTTAYYFPEGSQVPSDHVQFAKNVSHANAILYDLNGVSKWTYSYMHSLKGEKFLINCDKNPEDGLCRP